MIFNKLLKNYNEFDTKCKRCFLIDLYSIIFIIIPKKYIIKRNIISFIILLFFHISIIKGNDSFDKIDIINLI